MTLDEMISSEGFHNWQADNLGNDLFINDPDRAERIHDAAEHGCDGSTHAEHIQDWRDYLDSLSLDDSEHADIESEIDQCYLWHLGSGSLDNQCS